MSFDNIIGNDENKKILNNSIINKNIVHSYLFYGADGIGKKIFAKEFAKMILCNGEDTENKPCNICKSCIEFDSDNNPDFFLIEPDGNSIKIDQIRQMQKSVLEKPIESTKKVYIIEKFAKKRGFNIESLWLFSFYNCSSIFLVFSPRAYLLTVLSHSAIFVNEDIKSH